eukprot:scaffold157675_cov21-Tisochrysis_lutea.AAC.5
MHGHALMQPRRGGTHTTQRSAQPQRIDTTTTAHRKRWEAQEWRAQWPGATTMDTSGTGSVLPSSGATRTNTQPGPCCVQFLCIQLECSDDAHLARTVVCPSWVHPA